MLDAQATKARAEEYARGLRDAKAEAETELQLARDEVGVRDRDKIMEGCVRALALNLMLRLFRIITIRHHLVLPHPGCKGYCEGYGCVWNKVGTGAVEPNETSSRVLSFASINPSPMKEVISCPCPP